MNAVSTRRRVALLARALAATVVGVAGVVTGPVGAGVGAASADPGPATPTLSDLHVGKGRVSALLTFPGSTSRADAQSLRASFGSRDAGPVTVSPVAQERRAALLLVDTSGSMAGAGLAAAISAGRQFLAQVPDDVAVGLATFADRPRVLVAPTLEHARVAGALDRLHAGGGTALFDALRMATRALGHDGSRTLVVLSDGGDTDSRSSLSATLAAVRRSGVRTAAVGFQTGTSQHAVLERVARAGRGTLTSALDSGSLERAFGSAARALATQLRIVVPVPGGANGQERLTVAGTVGGAPFAARTAVTLPANASASAGAGPSTGVGRAATSPPGALDRSTSTWVAAGAVFVGLLAVVLLAAAPVFTGAARRRARSLDRYVGTSARRELSAVGGVQNVGDTLLRAGSAWARARSQSTRAALLLERADLPLRLEEWYVLRGLALLVGAGLVWMPLRGSLVGSITGVALGLVVGAGVPAVLLRVLAARRARRFELQLPDVLTLMASSLSTGFSLPQAIDAIVRDAAEPASKEFARTLAETRIGADLEDALEHTATRMASINLAWTTMAVRIQRQVGGNLAETLRTTAVTLRDRESLRRQVRALSAEGRLSAYILVALPLFLAGYLWLTNRDYLSLLWTAPLGITMLAVSGVLLVVGIFWMRRVVTVEV